jgi:Ca2+-binding EF-hand superfamily protein
VFDKDMSGFVSSSELKFVMSNLGVNFTDEELLEMMIEVTFFYDNTVRSIYENNFFAVRILNSKIFVIF